MGYGLASGIEFGGALEFDNFGTRLGWSRATDLVYGPYAKMTVFFVGPQAGVRHMLGNYASIDLRATGEFVLSGKVDGDIEFEADVSGFAIGAFVGFSLWFDLVASSIATPGPE